MSVKWTISNMKKWYNKYANDFEGTQMRALAEELREAMMSTKPHEARSYISTWYASLSIYYEQQENQTEENELLMDLLQANSDAISDDKRLAYEIIGQMIEFFTDTPVPVHPHAKEIEALRLFHEKQFEMRQQYEKEQRAVPVKKRKLRKANP